MYTTPQSPILIRHWSLWPFSFLHPAGRGELAKEPILLTARASTLSGKASSSFFAEGFMATE
jgi:hypothetical protein